MLSFAVLSGHSFLRPSAIVPMRFPSAGGQRSGAVLVGSGCDDGQAALLRWHSRSTERGRCGRHPPAGAHRQAEAPPASRTSGLPDHCQVPSQDCRAAQLSRAHRTDHDLPPHRFSESGWQLGARLALQAAARPRRDAGYPAAGTFGLVPPPAQSFHLTFTFFLI